VFWSVTASFLYKTNIKHLRREGEREREREWREREWREREG
jgi:hypothetical protein